MPSKTNELMPETNVKLKFSTKISYGLGDFASNLSWCLVTTYLLFFYTDIFKLNLAAIGMLFFVARIWDAINDPIMGYIADKNKIKMGEIPAVSSLRTYIPFNFYRTLFFCARNK